MTQLTRMVIDTPNLLFRVASVNNNFGNATNPEDKAGLALHMAINSINKYFKKIQPDEVAVIFEGRQNWRKAYTKSAACVSKRLYKGNRVQEEISEEMQCFFTLMNDFEGLVRDHTALTVLSHPQLEGDDSFAAYVQWAVREHPNDVVIGVSGDRDFAGLLKHKQFTLINPDDGKARTVEGLCGVDDAEYWMFEKCFRGDKGDNVWPAYPRVRATALKKAYAALQSGDVSNSLEYMNLMNKTWDELNEDGSVARTFNVGDLYRENKLLMDLEAQPPEIRAIMEGLVPSARESRGKYSYFHFMKFCGAHGLEQIAKTAANYGNLFSATSEKAQRQSAKAKGHSLLSF